MKIEVKSVLLIIFVSSFCGITYNYFSPTGIPLIPEEKVLKWADDSLFNKGKSELEKVSDLTKSEKENNISLNEERGKIVLTEKQEGKPNEEIKKKHEKELREPAAINLTQAYKLFQRNILFIDAREPVDYQASHIKNAINIPFDHFDEYKHLLDNIDKEKTIVTYCAGTDCDLSILLGNMLLEMGYNSVYIFFGGWNEWLEAGYPIEENTEQE